MSSPESKLGTFVDARTPGELAIEVAAAEHSLSLAYDTEDDALIGPQIIRLADAEFKVVVEKFNRQLPDELHIN